MMADKVRAMSRSVESGGGRKSIELPKPAREGKVSVETALEERRSIRSFVGGALSLEEISQLLWAAQGVNHPRGFRTAPSAGATYPLEVHLLAGNVEGLEPGAYRFEPADHRLVMLAEGDLRREAAVAALGQSWIAEGSAVLIVAARYERTTRRYGERGIRYVHMEAGHAGENIYLQAGTLGLGVTVVGAFEDRRVAEVARLADGVEPLYVIPVGRR